MKKISRQAAAQLFVTIPEVQPPPIVSGIESRKLLAKMEALGQALNDQANQVDEWREEMIGFLTRPLVDQEEGAELQGDEYDASTKQQDDIDVHMTLLNAVITDRQDALLGTTNDLTRYEVMNAQEQAKKASRPNAERVKALLAMRTQIKPSQELGSVRGIIAEMRALTTSLNWQMEGGSSRAQAELEIIQSELQRVQRLSTEQVKVVATLEKYAQEALLAVSGSVTN